MIILSVLAWFTRPTHGAWLPLTQQRNKISAALGERNIQQARDDREACRQLQVREILRDGLGNLDHTKMLQPQVLSDNKDLLPVLVWPEDLGGLSDDKHAKISVEQPEQVVCVRDDITLRLLIPATRDSIKLKLKERGVSEVAQTLESIQGKVIPRTILLVRIRCA
jgi:hypothetical protein